MSAPYNCFKSSLQKLSFKPKINKIEKGSVNFFSNCASEMQMCDCR